MTDAPDTPFLHFVDPKAPRLSDLLKLDRDPTDAELAAVGMRWDRGDEPPAARPASRSTATRRRRSSQ